MCGCQINSDNQKVEVRSNKKISTLLKFIVVRVIKDSLSKTFPEVLSEFVDSRQSLNFVIIKVDY